MDFKICGIGSSDYSQPKPIEQPKPKDEPEVELTFEEKMSKHFEEAKVKSEQIMKDIPLKNQNVRTRKNK